MQRLLIKIVEALAKKVGDGRQGRQYPVAKIVFAQMVPEMFDGVKLGTVRRQSDQAHAWGDA